MAIVAACSADAAWPLVQFTKLRLTGFKSFVDSTELVIDSGLTGIVGPNGCGKSNLVEALRWVMGETSAKRMRGGEMDDVIFGGSANRPARNIAEVCLWLDNSQRQVPAQFNDQEELEVARRIERGEGSIYRVNGREVRARDVQLLFADAATGARRSAWSMVRWTSAWLRAGRSPEPEKITSSMPAARSDLCDVSPITQRSASTRLDLPHPFGPTTPVRPCSIWKSVGSTKDLNPSRRSLLSFIRYSALSRGAGP